MNSHARLRGKFWRFPGRLLLRGASALLLAGLLAWFALPVRPAQAHAELLGSNPAPGQMLTSFPKTAELSFSENIEPSTARVRLLNASGEVLASCAVRVDPSVPRTLLAVLPSQPDGVYSLDWEVFSAVDGHDTSGTIGFSVGLSSPRASLLPPPDAPDPAADLPSAAQIILRGLAYLSLAVMEGAALFAVLVWRPAFQSVSPDPSADLSGWDAWMTWLLKLLVMFGAIAALCCMAAVLLYQSLQLTPDQTAPVWQSLLAAFIHQEGSLVWVRLLVLPLAAVLSALLPGAGRKTATALGGALAWWEIVGLGLIALLSYSLSGHNAALGSPFPVIGDWLHFTAMTTWIGGLVPLAGLLLHQQALCDKAAAVDDAEGTLLLDRASHRFSRLALISVIVLALSGLYSGLLQVRTLPALVGTRYGQSILVKSGLFLVLIGLGAINQRAILPRIARLGQRALRRLGQSVRVEIALGALLLLAVGGLMSLTPAFEALQADRRMGLHESWQGDGVRMDFRLAPVQVGDNEFALDVVDSRPGADQAVSVALLRIQAADGSTGAVQIQANLTADHRYIARGSYLSKMGVWKVLAIWRKPGFNDVTHVFVVDLRQWANDP